METLKRIVLVVLALCAIALLNHRPATVRAQEDAATLATIEDQMKQWFNKAVRDTEETVGYPVDPRTVTVVSLASGWRYSLDEGLTRSKTQHFRPPGAADPLEQEGGAAPLGSSTLCCYPSGVYAPLRRVVSWQGYAGVTGFVKTPTSANMCGPAENAGWGWIYFGFKNYQAYPPPGPGLRWVPDFEGGLESGGTDQERWYVFHSWIDCQSVEKPPGSGNWKWVCSELSERETWPESGIPPDTIVSMGMRMLDDGLIQFHVCPWGFGCHYFYYDAPGMPRAPAEQRVRRLHSLVVAPTRPPSGNPCGCGWGNCTDDLSYGYLKAVDVWQMELHKWENNSWHYYWWTPNITKTDWPMDEPDTTKPQCSDNCGQGDFCPDYVYANEIHQYYEETVSLQAYCNPDRYPQQCSTVGCAPCRKFCGTCPWPHEEPEYACPKDQQTGECPCNPLTSPCGCP